MDLNQRPQRKKMIPIRLQDPMENTAKSKKPEPVVTKKSMSVPEGKIFQCSICKVKFNSKMSCQQNSVMLGHMFYSLPTELGNARVRVRVNSTSRWRWQLACPYSANLRNPSQDTYNPGKWLIL